MRDDREEVDRTKGRSNAPLAAAILGGCLLLAAVLVAAILASARRREERQGGEAKEDRLRERLPPEEGPKALLELMPATRPTAAELADLAVLRDSWNTVGKRIVETDDWHPDAWDELGVRLPGIADNENWSVAFLTLLAVLAHNSVEAAQARMRDLPIPVRGGGTFTLRAKVAEVSAPDHLGRWRVNPLLLHTLDDTAYRLKLGPWKPSPAGSPPRPDREFYQQHAPGWCRRG